MWWWLIPLGKEFKISGKYVLTMVHIRNPQGTIFKINFPRLHPKCSESELCGSVQDCWHRNSWGKMANLSLSYEIILGSVLIMGIIWDFIVIHVYSFFLMTHFSCHYLKNNNYSHILMIILWQSYLWQLNSQVVACLFFCMYKRYL